MTRLFLCSCTRACPVCCLGRTCPVRPHCTRRVTAHNTPHCVRHVSRVPRTCAGVRQSPPPTAAPVPRSPLPSSRRPLQLLRRSTETLRRLCRRCAASVAGAPRLSPVSRVCRARSEESPGGFAAELQCRRPRRSVGAESCRPPRAGLTARRHWCPPHRRTAAAAADVPPGDRKAASRRRSGRPVY